MEKASEKNLDLLNGYWEIARVKFPDGGQKEYNVNTSIDYISVKNREGFRKKVLPKLNGTFDTSDHAIPFSILKKEDRLVLNYKNQESEWQEEILELSERNFSVKNKEGLIYEYKRFEPIDLEK